MGKKNRNGGKELSEPSPKIVKKKGKWRLGLVAAAAALGSVLWFGHPTDPTFEEAKQDKSKRADYVEFVERKYKLNELPYLHDVRYVDRLSGIADGPPERSAMAMSGFHYNGSDKKARAIIHVYDVAFDNLSSTNQFLSVLIDHEIEGHARPSYFDGFRGFENISIPSDRYFEFHDPSYFTVTPGDIFLELYAYRNQLEVSKHRGLNEDETDEIRKSQLFYYHMLFHPQIESMMNPETLKRLRADFFLRDFMYMDISVPSTENDTNWKRGTEYKKGKLWSRGPIITKDGNMMTPYGLLDLPDYLKEKADRWRSENR